MHAHMTSVCFLVSWSANVDTVFIVPVGVATISFGKVPYIVE